MGDLLNMYGGARHYHGGAACLRWYLERKKRLSESVSWAVHMRCINFKFVVQCMDTVDKLKLVVMYMYGGLF